MEKMKLSGGGLLLLLLLSFLGCENRSPPPENFQGVIKESPEDYTVRIVPPESSGYLPFSLPLTEVVDLEKIVIPDTKSIKIKVDYEEDFTFLLRVTVPESRYYVVKEESTGNIFSIDIPDTSVIDLEIFPLVDELPPFRASYNVKERPYISVSYPYPAYVTGKIDSEDDDFLDGYRVKLLTEDGFSSASASIDDGYFKIPVSPSEHYTIFELFSVRNQFFPDFEMEFPHPVTWRDLDFKLRGTFTEETLTLLLDPQQNYPFFFSVLGETTLSLTSGKLSARGYINNSVLLTSIFSQIKMVEGSYDVYLTPSSVSGYATWVTSFTLEGARELDVKFTPAKDVTVRVFAPDGKPLSGASVEIEPVPGVKNLQTLPVSGKTNWRGVVRLKYDYNFPFSFSLIRVFPPSYYRGIGEIVILTGDSLSDDSPEVDIVLPRYRIRRLKLVNTDEKPVGNANVQIVENISGLSVFGDLTDDRGYVELPVPVSLRK